MTTNPTEITNADLLEAFTGFRAEILGRIDGLEKKLDDASAERQAIRTVVDNELASHGQVMQIDGRLSDIERALKRMAKTPAVSR